MNNSAKYGFAAQVLAALLAVLIIHSIFTVVIRPQAEADIQLTRDLGEPAPRTISVMLKDYEQEASFILFVWAMGIIVLRFRATSYQVQLLDKNYLPRKDDEKIKPDTAAKYIQSLNSLQDPAEREAILPKMLTTGLHHFNGTEDISSATEVSHQVSESEADHMEAELSMVRYIAWAIPSVGFIGTVRGIGEALSKAGEALDGDIAGITESLGVAFNSTLVALLLSIVLMFFLHHLQMRQDRLILRCNAYCHKYLLSQLTTK